MSSSKLFVIAGPCVVESREMLLETAGTMSEICSRLGLRYIFKASYKKANRTAATSFQGIGDSLALEYLAEVKEKYQVETLTDVHSPVEAKFAAEYVNILQIPAFLSRQTELLLAAGETGRIVNIKKGQFMAAKDMKKAAEKVEATGNNNIWLTERGTFFGYHDLVVDFRSLVIMRNMGYPVIYDATHSVQQPSLGEVSGGHPEYAFALARAAAAVGIDGIFFETHPNPMEAKSDAATQLPLKDAERFLEGILAVCK